MSLFFFFLRKIFQYFLDLRTYFSKQENVSQQVSGHLQSVIQYFNLARVLGSLIVYQLNIIIQHVKQFSIFLSLQQINRSNSEIADKLKKQIVLINSNQSEKA